MASHVEAVYERVDDVYKLPLLLLDWSGARVSSIYEARASATTTASTAVSGCARRR